MPLPCVVAIGRARLVNESRFLQNPEHVLLVESLGRQQLVTVDLGGASVKVLVGEGTRPVAGTNVGLGFTPHNLHRFDSTGTRIAS